MLGQCIGAGIVFRQSFEGFREMAAMRQHVRHAGNKNIKGMAPDIDERRAGEKQPD